MPRTASPRRKAAEEHTHIAIRVERYDADITASVNHSVHAAQYAWNLNDDDPVYEFTNQLRITGTATYPPLRAGNAYLLTLYGTAAPSHHLDAKLKDVQARDEHGSPQYRKYRGREIPVFVAPKGLGLLDKVRGETSWTGWIIATPRLVTDALVLLGKQETLFVALHERKIDRARWIQRVSLQTKDPSEE
jgi:hypothetical protein